MSAKKKESLEEALAKIEKKYGRGIIVSFDSTHYQKVEAIPTGSLRLDNALGVGGVPKGRIIEIYGPESSGKTSLAYSIIKQAQLMGGHAAFIDMEHAFDYDYACTVGVDTSNLTIIQPDYGEQALDIVQTLVESGNEDVIVIDSVAALVPKAEIDGDMGDAQIGLQARLMSQAMRKLSGIISKSGTCVIFINQIRMKIGVMYGSPETTTGGVALKFYATVRIELRRVKNITKGDVPIGIQVKAKIVKNKVAPPFKVATFDIYFDEGVSTTADVIDLAVEKGIIKKAGAWLSYNGEHFAQGLENARKRLREDTELFNTILKQVQETDVS